MPSPNLNPAAKTALKKFRASKPWRGTFEERWEKFMTLRQKLSEACDVAPILEFHGNEQLDRPGNGAWLGRRNTIVLTGKLSVVTFLMCFAGALGMTRDDALGWAQGIFRHYFPRSFGGCRRQGDLLLRDQAMRN